MTYSDIQSIWLRRQEPFGESYTAQVDDTGFVIINGIRRGPVLGYYSGTDGLPLFTKLRGILENADFYSLRLRQPTVPYVDGSAWIPES